MVKIALEKNLYDDIHIGFLGAKSLPDKFVGAYDIVIVSGALNKNHAPPEALDDVFLALKPNGIAVFSLPDIIG